MCLLIGLHQLQAQTFNARTKTLAVTNDTLRIDSLSIIPGTVQLSGLYIHGNDTLPYAIDSGDYILAYFSGELIFKGALPQAIRITYQVFPYNLTAPYYLLDPAGYDSTDIRLSPYTITAGSTTPYLQVDGLDYSGSFSRGLSFGNNQDVAVNSTFNVQMNGRLQNDVDISASITDNNIPIQPEGNTQQLQEFDKVFIRLSKNNQSLTMGDYEMWDQGGYFMQFYKKLQGANYSGQFKLNDGSTLQSSLSAAVARGIHVRQTLSVIEGNQGPYKLQGNNGETFIIILAGTERIYMDGVLLVRGAEQDYIIDYNAGEITFTPRILLTKDKRVYVEFEYADRQYFRTLAYAHNNFTSGDEKWKMRLQVYSEQDSKNQPLDQTLGSTERALLENAGDSTSAIYAPGIDSIAFDASRVLYKMIDSLGFDSVFVYSTNPDSAFYALTFSEVGANKGNYIQLTSTTNGKVYQWVAPVDGIPQGTAEPVTTLIAPRRSQMVSFAAQYTPSKKTWISNEIALSNNDLNTFSLDGNSDNTGIGVRSGLQQVIAENRAGKLSVIADYEFAGKTFNSLERYRPVEFARNWNIFSTERTNEHYANAGLQFNKGETLRSSYQSSLFIREGLYQGFLQTLNGNYNSKTWQAELVASMLQADADSIQSTFIRPKLTISRGFSSLANMRIGGGFEGEHNIVTAQTDSILANSFYFDQYTGFIGLPDSLDRTIRGDIIYRIDKVPSAGNFALQTTALTYSLQGSLRKKAASQLYWQLHYRTLTIADTALTTLDPENTLLGRLQHIGTVKKGFITSDVLYEIGTGREQQRSYTYVETEPGAGLYTWNDYNENGVQELNEFELAVFTDQANFIQVFVPTNTYIQTNSTTFSYAFNINPKVLWHGSKGLEGFLAKFNAQSNLQMNRKVFDDQSADAYNPFALINDSLLVSSATYWVNTLFFNRASNVFGMDYAYIRNYTKQVITVGPERRSKEEHKISMRYKPGKTLVVNGTVYSGTKSYLADAFTDRNYSVPYTTYEPKLTYNTFDNKFRTSTTFQFTQGKNQEGGETLSSRSGTIDLRYSVASKTTMVTKLSYVQIDFSGDADSPVGYAMLEGLQNGNNILWSFNIDRKLSQVLQLTAGYEGRKTGDNPITHIGRLQMRAVF